MTRVEPALRFDNPWGRLGGEATVRGGTNGTRMERGNLDFVAETPAWRGFRISNSMTLERVDVRPGFANRRGNAESVVSFSAGGSGGWFGLAAERSPGSDAQASFYGNSLQRAGLWRQIGPLTLIVSTETHAAQGVLIVSDSALVTDSTNASHY